MGMETEDWKELAKNKQKENPFLPAHTVIHDILWEKIINCDLEPGALLKEVDLSERFGVSRTTIRNALDVLHQENLAERKGRNLRVTVITRAQYTQLHEFRRYVDPIAASFSAARRTKDDLERLHEYLLEGDTEDPQAFMDADHKFHHMIYQASKNQYLLKAYMQIVNDRNRINHFSVSSLSSNSLWEFSASKRKRMREEHQQIFTAIEQADERLAGSLAKRHVGLLIFDFDSYEKK
ncbi:GntR family transcriptional regulator [Clostridium sp. AM58-1XD]|uniref:GntR family transcriptional regulator n=1 Tax=Clostridium sp. AM58-1XD TaxID=2292307 RepID=UPI000E4F2C1B|nr:GntR family transcriptional regulator [Clostridium sp. AM58-1XD]RGZ01184.1 GntR family transcriptional regulator [Clostridium sp. AM58-1XD]